MTISKPCQQNINLPIMFWTSVFLLLITKGAYCIEDQSKFEKFSKFESEPDVEAYSTPDTQETYNMMNVLRELIQRHHQQQQQNHHLQQQQQHRGNQQQLQVYNNGEDLSENQIDWKKVSLPLIYQIRALINDGKEKDKRGSYMLPCHFKVCNLG